MIKHFSINNFGSLQGFSNSECLFPNGNIIVHGMNGSGKSQISSVLQKIAKLKTSSELGQSHLEATKKEIAEYFISRKTKENSTENKIQIKVDNFELSIDITSRVLTYSGQFPMLYVFNDNYISENVGDIVNLPDKTIKIGERNKERDELHGKIKKSQKALEQINKNIEDLVRQTKLDSGFLEQARTARIISVANYLLDNNPSEQYKDARSKLNSLSTPPEPLTFHFSIQFPSIDSIQAFEEDVESIFKNVFIEPKLTKEFYLAYLKPTKAFYEKGVMLFKNEMKVCPFCLTPKDESDSNISELIQYIDSNYNENLEKIKSYYNNLIALKKKIGAFVSQWNVHITTINEKATLLGFADKINELQFLEGDFNNSLNIIDKKINNMALVNSDLSLTESICEKLEQTIKLLNTQFQLHKDFIEKINLAIENISSTKRNLGEQVIKDHMFNLWENKTLRERRKELKSELEVQEAKYSELASSMSNDRTVHFFNKIIKILGINKYELNETSSIILKINTGYDISKEGYRISTGERKFIAMSYFFAEVLSSVENSTGLKNISILVDDPIDSSDYQKFYSFISVIENFNSILQAIYRNKEIELGQFIIFTHNALLFERLINSKKVTNFQLLQEDTKSKIIKPQKNIGLITFSSYLQKVTNYIKRMERSNNKEIGNYIRRVLEIIASVENVDNNKIECLNATSKLNALANHLSHESLERILDPLPESHEYVEACIELIEEIERRIPALYGNIVKNYLNNKGIGEYRQKFTETFLN